jgi:hypothetical protein
MYVQKCAVGQLAGVSTSPVRQSGSGEAGLGCCLGHVWGEIRYRMLLGNPLVVGPCYLPQMNSQLHALKFQRQR